MEGVILLYIIVYIINMYC